MIQSANDKNFDDEDSVDGNRPSSASSTSSKAPPSSRRNVGMGPTRRLGSSTLGSKSSAAKEGAGAVDEEDFIKAFDDVPVVQIYSSRDLEESINKIREILSDDKHDWEQRVNALKRLDLYFWLVLPSMITSFNIYVFWTEPLNSLLRICGLR